MLYREQISNLVGDKPWQADTKPITAYSVSSVKEPLSIFLGTPINIMSERLTQGKNPRDEILSQ